MNNQNEDIEKENKLKTSVFFIEANSFEVGELWKQEKDETKWEEDLMGFTQVVGYIDKKKTMPVNVCFTFAKLYGQRVCFFNVCSRWSDSVMVEEFLKTNYPTTWDNGHRNPAITDAMNFHLATQECQERSVLSTQ